MRDMYLQMGLAQERLIFRLPATWQGIQACRQLEAQGVATQVFLVYRWALGHMQGIWLPGAGVCAAAPAPGQGAGRCDDADAQEPGLG